MDYLFYQLHENRLKNGVIPDENRTDVNFDEKAVQALDYYLIIIGFCAVNIRVVSGDPAGKSVATLYSREIWLSFIVHQHFIKMENTGGTEGWMGIQHFQEPMDCDFVVPLFLK